eukprot:TRINITY_DN41184_c0_g1_i1.p1 TRINITY_DN41184_c0_g1~~TRINITY_DN41184_c0_g1_i1.p1  ORF type:complete len:565 (+),score=77.86 TRINITY_DN41184_c0_g1_i1:77-1771(+)
MGSGAGKDSGSTRVVTVAPAVQAPEVDLPEVEGPPQIGKPEVSVSSDIYKNKPYVDGAFRLIDGKVLAWDGECADIVSPIFETETGSAVVIGRQAILTPSESQEACNAANLSWDAGRGVWASKSLEQRIEVLLELVKMLKLRRAEIVSTLQWEICKNDADAAKEFDRTMDFIVALIQTARDSEHGGSLHTGGFHAVVRRSPVGVMMNFGPMNYPFNETYATLIPGLLMGNSVVMKIPSTGGAAHFFTMEAYAKCLPPGVVNFVSGPGRNTMPPVMETGKIDMLAFVGNSKTADTVLRYHPNPHRLRTLLSLDGKNLGIVLPDADIRIAARECLLGSTSFNGQRCTAIKLIMVHNSVVEQFNAKFCSLVNGLVAGAPFGKASVTPLPELKKPAYLAELVADAIAHGAEVINLRGGECDRTLFFPAVLFPVTSAMRAWKEEQFGPLIPIARYDSIDEVYKYLKEASTGQQVSIFTSSDAGATPSAELSQLLDVCALSTCRVNVNVQCQRGPDSFPFAGRRSSALGTISVAEALRAVSVETMVASKQSEAVSRVCQGSAVFAAVHNS